MGAAWRHVLMRLRKCVVSLPPLGWLQKVSKGAVWCFFGTAEPLLWLFHLLGDSLSLSAVRSLAHSLSLSLSPPPGLMVCWGKRGALIGPGMSAHAQTHGICSLRCRTCWHGSDKGPRAEHPKVPNSPTSTLNPPRSLSHLFVSQLFC